jgi:putative heme iron utilization protein
MSHEPRLSQGLRALLQEQRVAALGTLTPEGQPFVSMTPFARVPAQAAVILHVSALAPHSAYMQAQPQVSLLVMQAATPGAPVHDLARVSFAGQARTLQAGAPDAVQARQTYLRRFPEAEPMTALGDFCFVRVDLMGARQVAGFGAARQLDAVALAEILALG